MCIYFHDPSTVRQVRASVKPKVLFRPVLNVPMTEKQSDRLRKVRIQKGFSTSSDAARAYGWNQNTYISHENGNRGLSPKSAERYARAYGVGVGWLLTGENPPRWMDENEIPKELRPVRQVPRLTMQELSTLHDGTIMEHLARCTEFAVIGIDPKLGAHVFEIVLDDGSMSPYFKTGETVTVDPEQKAEPGDYVLAVIRGNALFRWLRNAGLDDEGRPLLELAPINEAWAAQPVTEDTWIVGPVLKHTRDVKGWSHQR